MSELVIPVVGLTLLAGYFFNKDGKSPRNGVSKSVEKFEKPNGNNIYSSNRVNEINAEVLNMSTQNYVKSENPAASGVLPPLFNTYSSKGAGINEILQETGGSEVMRGYLKTNRLQNPLGKQIKAIDEKPMFNVALAERKMDDNEEEKSLLTGLPLDKTHRNMTPFFGSKIKQNIETFSNEHLLDVHTGNASTYRGKVEVQNMFDVKEQNIYGSPVFSNNIELERYIPSVFRQGEKVVEDMKVSAPKSGTYENNIRPIFKSVDDLRVVSKPKESYAGRTLAGQMGEVRGIQSKVEKRRPETYYEKTKDHLFTTTTNVLAETSKEDYSTNFKNTSRQDYNTEYYGGASSVQLKYKGRIKLIDEGVDNSNKIDIDSLLQNPKRQNYGNDYIRNIGGEGYEKMTNDYGKGSINLHETERATTAQTHLLNSTKTEFGVKTRYMDKVKPTIKETTGVIDNTGNIKTSYNKGKNSAFIEGLSNLELKQTHKETTVINDYTGNVNKGDGMGYLVNKYQPRDTQKEDIIHRDRSSGPQSFNTSLGKTSFGEMKHTANMMLKERMDERPQTNVNTQQVVPDKNLLGYVQRFRVDNGPEDTIHENRIQPDLIQSQHDNNPFSIYNRSGK
uniref:Uncharacterized protein n=1 Tax=viral metagenome TaxID=1070528 RepID=A0A6C0E117_9ZZZZ